MTTTRPRRPRSRVATVLLIILTVCGMVGLGPVGPAHAAPNATAEAEPATVTTDSLPTWQINGVVWSQVVIGHTVYAAGEFSEARPPGVAAGGPGSVPVGNLIAYDIRTGNRIASFNHTLNAQAMTIAKSPDESRIYVGGDFTVVDGQARSHIAAFDTATGDLVQSFQPMVRGRVRAIAVSSNTVYAGGEFGVVGNSPRTRLAAFSTSGSLLPWAPATDNYYVWSMVMTPDQSKVVVGGQMEKIDGVTVNGMAALDATSGAVLPWAANQTIIDYDQGAIMGLKTDGEQIYGSGFAFGNGGKFEGEFALDPQTGEINWLNDCQGDTYDTWPMDGVLYTVSHVHSCEMIGGLPQLSDWGIYQRLALAFSTQANTVNDGPNQYGWNYKGIAGSKIATWFPDLSWGNYTQYGQSGWSITGNGDYLAIGGEFLAVNGRGQQGLVRMAVREEAPNKRGPVIGYDSTDPGASSELGGTASVSWNAAWDPEDSTLTYKVYRSGTSAAVHTTERYSQPWEVPRMNFLDSGLAPGATHTYRIEAVDSDGNVRTLAETPPVTIQAGAASAYAVSVLQEGASGYWRMGEPSGTNVVDWAGTNDAVTRNTVVRNTTGAISGDSDTASTFSSNIFGHGHAIAQTRLRGPDTFSLQGWFRTTTNQGGKIIGFGNANSGSSSNYDRHVYMDSAGRLWFGVHPGHVETVNSAATYNDGAWHQVVATLGPDGMGLYVDGELQDSKEDVSSAQAYEGYWRIAGDNLNGWPSASSAYFSGAIDEVAVYPSALTAQQVENNYQLGTTGALPNQPPTAAFTSSVDELTASFDGSGSSDPDGSITSYGWAFGDGAEESGDSVEHVYAEAGTYTVTLTVTDDDGAADSISHDVTVVDPPDPVNVVPVAVFESSAAGLSVSFDGSGSSDSDGSVASYAWDFGDGAEGSGASVEHTFAEAGTYSVVLTVTDDDGATDSVSHDVTVTAPGAAIVVDDFNRSVDDGLGSADTGGAWTVTGSASKFSVDGSAGKLELTTAGSSTNAYLRSVSATDVDLSVDVALDKQPVSSSVYTSVLVRSSADGKTYYSVKLRWRDDGQVAVYLVKTVNGVESTVASGGKVAGVSTADTLTVRFQAEGTSPTALQAKVWMAGEAEPSAWSVSGSDSTAALDAAGGFGLLTYLAGGVTNAPITAVFDNLTVQSPEEVEPAARQLQTDAEAAPETTEKAKAGAEKEPKAEVKKEPKAEVKKEPKAEVKKETKARENRAPRAAFTSSVDQLVVTFDGSKSNDPDGSIDVYSWDWGDDTKKGEGVRTKHSYTVPGEYTVTLTVTDDSGESHTSTHDVTVAAPGN